MGCKARIMEGPNTGEKCGEDCAIYVDKTGRSRRFKRPNHTDVFLFPHKRGELCGYHQRLKDERFDPFFPDSLKGV